MRHHPLTLLRVVLATLSALAVVAVAGCSSKDTPTPSSAAIAHATGARDLLFRYSIGGGFAPPPPPADAPRVSLYGDGRIVVFGPGGATSARLSEPGIQRLLRVVTDAGLLDGANSFPIPGCADCRETVFTANFNGRATSVSVDELGSTVPARSDDAAYRRIEGLAHFMDALTLSTFRPGEITDAAGPFDSPGLLVRAAAIETFPPSGGIAWPAGLPSIESLYGGGVVCGAPADALATAAPSGAERMQSGSVVAFVVHRPLLPDDPGAEACAW